jgi:hypothetical protein
VDKKSKGWELEVLVGRAARANRAIFDTLVQKSPQTLKELLRHVCRYPGLEEMYYASLTKRLRCLEAGGYVRRVGLGLTGESVRAYELCVKSLVVMFLDVYGVSGVLEEASDTQLSCLLLALVNAVSDKDV